MSDPQIDPYAVALAHLRADERSLSELSEVIGLPKETLRDIKSGHIKFPRMDTARKIVAHYSTPRAAV